MKMLSLFCLTVVMAAGVSGCHSACCKDKRATEKTKECGPGCTKPCCAPKK